MVPQLLVFSLCAVLGLGLGGLVGNYAYNFATRVYDGTDVLRSRKYLGLVGLALACVLAGVVCLMAVGVMLQHVHWH